MHFMNAEDKTMSNGMRNTSGTLLTEEEIAFIEQQIARIEADPSVFVFNDEQHRLRSTCYNYAQDKVYVTRNVFPDCKYGSVHPRDIMSVAAVLAHEYYGHRSYRDEYLSDLKIDADFHTTPFWEDECRASITAAKITPNLTSEERRDLVMDAVYRARESGQLIEMDDFMKEIVYGYPRTEEKNITLPIAAIRYISESGIEGNGEEWFCEDDMPEMPENSKSNDEFER